MNAKQLANLFKTYRRKAGVTQLQLSRKLGYSTLQFVSNWERGIALPPIDTFEVMRKYLGLDPELFFDHYVNVKLKEHERSLTKQYERMLKRKR